MKIKATYLRRYLHVGDPDDSRPEYYVCVFTDVVNEKGKKQPDLTTKETKLLKAVSFKKGVEYEITFGEHRYPIEVAWGNGTEKVYLKNQNSIIEVDKNGKEKNHSANTIGQYFNQIRLDAIRSQAKKKK